jgi:hypothetical protein
MWWERRRVVYRAKVPLQVLVARGAFQDRPLRLMYRVGTPMVEIEVEIEVASPG